MLDKKFVNDLNYFLGTEFSVEDFDFYIRSYSSSYNLVDLIYKMVSNSFDEYHCLTKNEIKKLLKLIA
ncbi:MAG: hypothetical protein N2043_01425 [Ignavibacterium sp.]|nr:hypothetical protein [Ignavibacterium sp.]